MILFSDAQVWNNVYDNSLDALTPELWANEALAILYENFVSVNLVNRDFENELARFGDIVHTNRPGELAAKRKTTNDDVTIQDVTSTDVQVKLDQHVHTSFLIRDGEESYSFRRLVETYLKPAVMAQVRFIDRLITNQYINFLGNGYGSLLGLSNANVVDRILGVRGKMNTNKAYFENRHLLWTPTSETIALSNELFISAEKVGDTTAMREASLGRKFGFTNWMSQNTADISTGNTTSAGAINNASGYAKGVTSLTVDGITGTIGVNTWLKIAGDDTPQRVVSQTATLGNTTGLVISPGLRSAVVDNAVITFYTPGAINNSGGYAAGYSKSITVDGFSVAPQVGQLVTLGTTDTDVKYAIMEASTTHIVLDRPLESSVADNAAVNIGPAGSYNLALHPDAITLVVRPLAPVRPGTGGLSSVVNANKMSIRATISYDGMKQGHLVTLDMLCGIKTLDTNLGAVLFG